MMDWRGVLVTRPFIRRRSAPRTSVSVTRVQRRQMPSRSKAPMAEYLMRGRDARLSDDSLALPATERAPGRSLAAQPNLHCPVACVPVRTVTRGAGGCPLGRSLERGRSLAVGLSDDGLGNLRIPSHTCAPHHVVQRAAGPQSRPWVRWNPQWKVMVRLVSRRAFDHSFQIKKCRFSSFGTRSCSPRPSTSSTPFFCQSLIQSLRSVSQTRGCGRTVSQAVS